MRNTAPRRRTNVIEGRNSYMYMSSSAAPVLPQHEETYKRPKRPRPKPVERDYIRVRERRNVNILPIILLSALVVILSLALLTIHAKKSAVKAEIYSVQSLTKKVNASTERVEMMLNESIDMEEVKNAATTRLGMQPAAPYQIVSINVAKDSYSVQYDDVVAKSKNKTLLEKLGIVKSKTE